MKRSLLGLFLAIIHLTSVSPLSAQQVTERAAREKAVAFISQRASCTYHEAQGYQHKNPMMTLALGCDEYYVFNDNANGGYVVVSGDETAQPILGYSETNLFDPNNMPDNMRVWLEGYARQIKWLREHPSERAKKSLTEPSVSQLLGDIEWGQGYPYNLLCPEYGGYRCFTGCIATAMAQVMCYHQWPTTAAEIPGYTTDSLKLQVETIDSQDIDWDNILSQYNGIEKKVKKEAVAKLMLMCGSAVRMNYNINSSGAPAYRIPAALTSYFDYSVSAQLIQRSDYGYHEWNQVIYDELSEGRPVIYGGTDLTEENGHGFVVDGYDKDDYFHINWGWNGDYNGNFLLALLDPELDGNGGYNYNQEAIIGIKKAEFNEDGLKDGDTFTVTNTEGFDLTFQIISVSKKTCKVYSVAEDISGTVTIPVKAKGFNVVEIGAGSFYFRKQLKKVVMPNSITKIGHDAFFYCSQLESVDFSSSIKEIEYQAFDGCGSLTSIVIPEGVRVLPYNVFTGTGIKSVVPVGSASVAASAVIPRSVVTIVGSAFACCGELESVTLPNSVVEIGGNMACASFGNPFVGCNALKVLNVEEGHPLFHADGNCIIETATSCVSIGCNYSVLPSYIKHIGQHAFCNLNFVKFVVPEGVISVEDGAFNNSHYLEEVTLPSSLEYLDDYAFYYCSELKTLRVKMENPISIGNIFSGTGLETLYVPAGTERLYSEASNWRDFKNIIEMETKPILDNRTISMKSVLNASTNLDGVIIDGVYYNSSNTQNASYNGYGGCLDIYVNSNFMNEENEIEDLFDDSFRERFTGIVLKVPAGSGSIKLRSSSSANMWSAVKVGQNAPQINQTNGNIQSISFDVEDGTDVFIYGTTSYNSQLKNYGNSSSGVLKIFEIEVEIDHINKYDLTYLIDGDVYKSYELDYYTEISPEEEPAKEGYTFTGWSEIPNRMPAHDVTVTGSFAVNSYTLTYMVDGMVYKTYKVEYGATISPEEEPAKEGYTFTGWSNYPENMIMPSHDLIINGSFSINSYQLTYMLDEEIYSTSTLKYQEPIVPIAAPETTGYVFSGWIGFPDDMLMPAHDVTVTGTMTSGISTVAMDSFNTNVYYDLFGDKVKTLSKGRVYICNGKKIMIK